MKLKNSFNIRGDFILKMVKDFDKNVNKVYNIIYNREKCMEIYVDGEVLYHNPRIKQITEKIEDMIFDKIYFQLRDLERLSDLAIEKDRLRRL